MNRQTILPITEKRAPRSGTNPTLRGLKAQPEVLTMSALCPILDAPDKQQIIAAVVSAVGRSPAGRRINPRKLEGALESHFDRFLKGSRFDFGPVLKSMLKDKQLSEADGRAAAQFVEEALEAFGLSVVVPT